MITIEDITIFRFAPNELQFNLLAEAGVGQ